MIGARWERARDEWRANRRLRLAGMAALAFLGIHLLLAMGDRRAEVAERYGRDVELHARFSGMQEQKDWPERAEQAEAGLAEMRARIPAVTGAGLAQAEMQAWLTEFAGRTGLIEPKVKVEDTLDVPGYPDMWQVMARLDGQVPQYGQGAFLRALSEALPWIQAERLEIGEGNQPRVVLVVRGYYRQAGDEMQDAEAASAPAAAADPGPAPVIADPAVMPTPPQAPPPSADAADLIQPLRPRPSSPGPAAEPVKAPESSDAPGPTPSPLSSPSLHRPQPGPASSVPPGGTP